MTFQMRMQSEETLSSMRPQDPRRVLGARTVLGNSALFPPLPLPKRCFRPDEQERIDLHLQLYTSNRLPSLAMSNGELPLTNKVLPLCELSSGPERDAIPLATRRGTVDVEPALGLLRELPPAVWHEAEQAKSNVVFRRAAHDRWGVGKILLIMCDDDFTKVLHFPWLARWRPVLETIFQHLGVPESRVIRCLLAALPASGHIPTHHDTGNWVPLCHRIHVPVVTDSSVVFSVGYEERMLARIDTAPGDVFELNNAAKHTVFNGWDRPRIHLILDYIDEGGLVVPQQTLLVPGQRLEQTRRTIDVVPVDRFAAGEGDSSEDEAQVPPSR